MKHSLTFLIAISLVTGCSSSRMEKASAKTATIQLMRMPLRIGDTNIHAMVFQHGKPLPTFINVHDDENTSVAAGKAVIEQTSGRLIELVHSGKRLVRFRIGEERFSFDPNRVFSDVGIRHTLEGHHSYSEAAHRAVSEFAATYISRFALDREPVIIALHNNSEGALTIKSYQTGGEHAATAAEVHESATKSPDDFFYVTDRRFFDYLRQRDFNVTLQDNTNVPDDGSLSVYFGHKKIPYINVEAETGHLDAQTEMVRVVRQMVEDLRIIAPK